MGLIIHGLPELTVLSEFNMVSVTFRMIIAAIMGGLIGIERGKHGRAAGLRTHILICVGAAITSLTSLFLSLNLGFAGDITRISAQVISGIGFLGAGTILVRKHSVVTGLTTAAGLWTTAIIGVAVGYGFYLVSLLATLICIISFTLLKYVELRRKRVVYLYIELCSISHINKLKEFIQQKKFLTLNDIIPSKSGVENNIGVVCFISNATVVNEIESEINNLEEVVYTFQMVD